MASSSSTSSCNFAASSNMRSTPALNTRPPRMDMSNGSRFLNRPPSVPRACPSTPKFATAERATLRRVNSGSETKASTSTSTKPPTPSRPFNRRIFESPTIGVKKEKPQSPTKPIPFAFNTLERASVRVKSESDDEHQGELEKCFKALPLPSNMLVALPPKKVRPPTTVQPFNLETERLDAATKEKRRKIEEKERDERRRKMEFHASVMPDFNKPVFCPVLADKRHTEPENVQLSTDRRAEDRKKFEDHLKKKEEDNKEILRQRELEKQRLDEEEIRRLRAAAVHRAQPVRHFKPVEIKHDPSQITVPLTPKFHVDRRLLERPPSRNGMY